MDGGWEPWRIGCQIDWSAWGAIGTLLAIIVALYLARSSDRPSAKGRFAIVAFPPDPAKTRYFCFSVANLGTHSLHVHSAFMRVRWPFSLLVDAPVAMAFDWRAPGNSTLPTDLARGQSFRYSTSLGTRPFAAYMASMRMSPLLCTCVVRCGVSTPWGAIYLAIDRSARAELRRQMAEYRTHAPARES